MIEVEVKLQLSPASWSRVQAYVATMSELKHLDISDIYYDTSAFDLLRQAVFVRVRNQSTLEFKFNEQAPPAHLECTERVFSLKTGDLRHLEMNALFARFMPQWHSVLTFEDALSKNSLFPLAFIRNKRSQYVLNNLIISVDQVAELGNFLEIEIQCEEGGDTRRAQAEVLHLASELAARPLNVGYVELWLQKYNVPAYLSGKYHQE